MWWGSGSGWRQPPPHLCSRQAGRQANVPSAGSQMPTGERLCRPARPLRGLMPLSPATDTAHHPSAHLPLALSMPAPKSPPHHHARHGMNAGVDAPFELRLMSSAPLELVPLPETQTVHLPGEWGPETSGGCDVNPLWWKRNPKFHVIMPSFGRVRRVAGRGGRRSPPPAGARAGRQLAPAPASASACLHASSVMPGPTTTRPP